MFDCRLQNRWLSCDDQTQHGCSCSGRWLHKKHPEVFRVRGQQLRDWVRSRKSIKQKSSRRLLGAQEEIAGQLTLSLRGWIRARSRSMNVQKKECESICCGSKFWISLFRPSATVSRIGLMESRVRRRPSLSWRTPHPPPGWLPPPKVARDDAGCLMESCLSCCHGGPPAGYPPYVMDGYGARPLRWLSVLVWVESLESCPYHSVCQIWSS